MLAQHPEYLTHRPLHRLAGAIAIDFRQVLRIYDDAEVIHQHEAYVYELVAPMHRRIVKCVVLLLVIVGAQLERPMGAQQTNVTHRLVNARV